MGIQSVLSIAIDNFPILTTLITTFIFGEEVIIILGFLAGLDLLPLWVLIVFGFIGTLLSDILWFVVGKYVPKEPTTFRTSHTAYHRFMRYIDKITLHNMFVSLLITRFFYLFRLYAIVHVSRKGLGAKKFLLYEIPLILVWLTLFTSVGWVFGDTALPYLDKVKNFEMVLVIGILLGLILFVFKSILGQWFTRKSR